MKVKVEIDVPLLEEKATSSLDCSLLSPAFYCNQLYIERTSL